MKRYAACFLILAALWSTAASCRAAGKAPTGSAKTEKGKAPAKKEPEPPKPDPTVLPYDHDLNRLAEVMGSLAFLRDLCGFNDGASWRARMNDLIEAEGATTERRERLAGAFNRGFQGLQLTYRRCTPAAKLLVERLTDEGAQLTRMITTRYGT